MDTYLTSFSDREIEDMIRRFTPYQEKVFKIKLRQTGDQRFACFIAKSYPDDFDGEFKEQIS